MGGFNLPLSTITTASAELVDAANLMVEGNTRRPSARLESLTGIGAQVEHYLKGLSVARAALADAAKTASESARDLGDEARAVDRQLSGALASGFAVQGKQ